MSTFHGPDGKTRCAWSGAAAGDRAYLEYHDSEWGFPVGDDRRLFEKLCLEGFQAGLSWRTILAKRENFRRAFHDFDFQRIARYTRRDVDRLLGDSGIVRHRGKIEAVLNNARRALDLIEREGSLAAFFWRFEPQPGELDAPQTVTTSAQSVALSRALKQRGWRFVGPTTAFAFMQAMGLINDHVHGCWVRPLAARARTAFQRPVTDIAR